jgi:hypothetical protein
MRTIKAHLLEVGKDFQVKVKGTHGTPPRPDVRIVRFNSPRIEITTKALKEKVRALQLKYPDKGFSLERAKVKGKHGTRVFWILDRRRKGTKGVPVYYSTSLKRLFVPKRYVKKQYRLTANVLLYRLRDLGANYSLGYA